MFSKIFSKGIHLFSLFVFIFLVVLIIILNQWAKRIEGFESGNGNSNNELETYINGFKEKENRININIYLEEIRYLFVLSYLILIR